MKTRQVDASQRGQGFTTLQMQRAPQGALYIWPVHGSLGYARALAHDLGRDDLEIVAPSILDHRAERLMGRRLTGLVLDHACEPSAEEYEVLRMVRTRCLINADKSKV